MNPSDSDLVVEVVHTADRPEFSDRGDQAVQMTPDEIPAPKRKPARRRKAQHRADKMSDEELLTEAGVEPVFSTSEAAEFFDRSSQWLYWGLREEVFTSADGVPIDPDRIGHPVRGRRRFTVPILKEIMKSSYRRGNLDGEQLKAITRRIKYAEEGVEWREREGWHYANLGRSRYRWLPPQETIWDSSAKEWKQHPDYRSRKKDDE
jgi:hypothetical protein